MTTPKSERLIDHVVVLMLENRSFDHMLGLLDADPSKYDGVAVNDKRFFNPSDPTTPEANPVYVSDDATFRLSVDPPHSHASVVEQMGLNSLRPLGLRPLLMNGFVAAYKRAVAGEKGREVYHWGRIAGACVVLIALLAAVLALPWPTWLLAGALVLLAIAEVLIRYTRRKAPSLPLRSWRLYFDGLVVVFVALSFGLGLIGAYTARLAFLGVLLSVVVAFMLIRHRRKVDAPPKRPDQEQEIMRCMRPEQLPALAMLAKSFAVCTRWHCSVPGATWPNRLFAHAGTSDDTVDIEVGLYDNDTIFDRLKEASQRWHIYYHPHSLSQVAAFSRLTNDDNFKNWYLIAEFAEHVASERLPEYAFIEPCHDGPGSNSQHPGSNDFDRPPDSSGLTDFERGERLIASVYEILRKKREVFDKTILIITYDEHGGFYDHVPPPTKAVAPTAIGSPKRKSILPLLFGLFVEQPTSRFKFNVLGPRVPAIVVSPLIQPHVDRTTYDHCAIPATVRKLFAPNTGKLSEREASSPTLDHLWSAGIVREDLPDLGTLYPPPGPALLETVAERAPGRPRDDEFARQMREVARLLGPKVVRKPPAPLFEQFGLPADGDRSTETVTDAPAAAAVADELTPQAVADALTECAREARGE